MRPTTDFSDLSFTAPPPDHESLAARDEVLAKLLDKLSRQPDFPSLGEALSGVRRVARSERARLQNLSEALLRDVGLANRVLRLANAAHYRSAGGGQIDTLSRAVAVMGFVEIGQIALSARLVDQLKDKRHSLALREEFLRALLAGAVAHELAHSQAEDGYLIAVFRNLGRMVACLHFPEDAIATRQATPRETWPFGQAEQDAARRILGADFNHLGQGVAERWGWPPQLRRAIRQGEEPPRHYPPSRTEQLRCMGWLANEMADLLIYQPPSRHDNACDALASRFGAATAHDSRSLQYALARARMKIESICEQLELPLSQLPRWVGTPDLLSQADQASSDAAPVDAAPAPVPPLAAPVAGGPAEDKAPAAAAAGAAVPSPEPGEAGATPAVRGVQPALLREAVHDIVDALAEGGDPMRLQTRILRSLLHGLGAQRAVLCLRQGSSGELVGKLGLGHGAPSLHADFLVPPADEHDLFSVLCERGIDSRIDDAADPAIARRLPHWWRSKVASRSFLVLPMQHEKRPIGMLYCDSPQRGGMAIDEATMKLVRTLRNQALLAWRQGG